MPPQTPITVPPAFSAASPASEGSIPVAIATDGTALLTAAIAALQRKDYRSALTLAEQVLSTEPRSARALHVLGVVALALEEPSRAIAMFEQAHAIDQSSHEHAEMLAIVYAKVGMLNDSLYYGKVATVLPSDPLLAGLIPNDIGSFADNLIGIREKPLSTDAASAASRGDYARAAHMFEQALELDQTSVESWRGLAAARLALDQPHEALVAHLAVRQLALDDPNDLIGLSHCLTALGRFPDAEACHLAALARAPGRAEFVAAMIGDKLAVPSVGVAEITRAAEHWASLVKPARKLPAAPARPLEGRPLRVGVVGSRFRDGAEHEPLMRLLGAHNPKTCQVYVYSANPYEDSRTRRFRNTITRWTNIARTDDDTAALLIRNDAPDILIDLDGFLPGGRPGIFARRPATLQASYLGLPEMAKVCGFDVIIGDAWTHPEDRDPAPGDAPVLRVPGGLFEIPAATAIRQPASDGSLVFGSLATRAQLTLDVISAWSAALHDVPNAQLLLDSGRLGGPEGLREIANQFAYFGVADRLIETSSEEGVVPVDDFVSAIDVLLAPFRQTSSITTAAAIAAGIPVIAHAGVFPWDRRPASQLAFAGRADSVAADADEYAAKMRDIAVQGTGIAPSTARSAEEVAASLEAAYRTLLV